MKILDDPTVFLKQKGCIFARTNHCSLYKGGELTKLTEYYCGDSGLYSECALHCYYAVHQRVEEPCNFRRINQDFYSADYILSGFACFRMGKQYFIAEPGDVVLLHPHNDTEILYPGETLTGSYGFCFNGELCTEVLRSLGLEHIFCLTIGKKRDFERCCEKLLNAVRNHRSQNERIVISGCLYEFLQRLSLEVHRQQTEELAERVHQYIRDHFPENITVGKLTQLFQVSPPTLKKVFCRNYHQTPLQYLQRLRFEQAVRMLVNSDCRIKEIALSSGFFSPQYFCAAFVKSYGRTPGEYRAEFKRTGKKAESP